MRIENSFTVQAPPTRVYEFLLDVHRVVGCVPGAQLSEVVDPDTFRGRVRIRDGPVAVSYQGVARITKREPGSRSATLEAEGRETTGSGSVRATTTMTVAEEGSGSSVTVVTELAGVGRIEQLGEGIVEEISRHLVRQMAQRVQARLEQGDETAELTGTPVVVRPAKRTRVAAPQPRTRRARRGAAATGKAPAPADAAPGPGGSSAHLGGTRRQPTAARERSRATQRAGPAPTPPSPLTEPGGAVMPRTTLGDDGEAAPAPPDILALARALGRERLSRLPRGPLLAAGAGLGAVLAVLAGRRFRRR
jgi:carbon monoxide dehydrogenase subunit G